MKQGQTIFTFSADIFTVLTVSTSFLHLQFSMISPKNRFTVFIRLFTFFLYIFLRFSEIAFLFAFYVFIYTFFANLKICLPLYDTTKSRKCFYRFFVPFASKTSAVHFLYFCILYTCKRPPFILTRSSKHGESINTIKFAIESV